LTLVEKFLVSIVLIAMVVLGVLCFLVSTPEPSGVWKDVDSEYYIKFLDNNEYVESMYNTRRSYRVNANTITFFDISGAPSQVSIARNLFGKVVVTLNGSRHVMRACKEEPIMSQWTEVPSGTTTATFKLKNEFDNDANFWCYDNYVVTGNYFGEKITGKWFRATDGTLLVFKEWGDSNPEVLLSAGTNYVCGVMNTDINFNVLKQNLIEDKGVLLSGSASIVDSTTGKEIMYNFYGDNKVTREVLGETSVSLVYYCDSDGLITINDNVGMGYKDYLYFDKENKTMYRYVFEPDSWANYLTVGAS